MPVTLQTTPVGNTLGYRVTLLNNGVIVATLEANDAQVLTLTFDQIGLYNPGLPPIIRNQNPAAPVVIQPGNLAYISNGPAPQTNVAYGTQGGQQTTIIFT